MEPICIVMPYDRIISYFILLKIPTPCITCILAIFSTNPLMHNFDAQVTVHRDKFL